MDFYPSKIKWSLACALAALLPASAVLAQSSIIFSKPADDVADKANAFMSQPSHGGAGVFNAPSPLFGGKPKADFDILPGAQPPAPLSPEQVKQWQKLIENKRDWILMTPAEIMGVQTPEQILGITDPDNDPNLSLTERYLKREEREQSMSVSNALRSLRPVASDDANPFQPSRTDRRTGEPVDGQNNQSSLSVRRAYGQLLDAAGNVVNQYQRADSPWGSAFPAPAAPVKPDLEQAARMERFRALEDSPSENPATPGSIATPVVALPDSNLEVLPRFNPAGNSFAPLPNTVARPTGIMPLPGLTENYKKPEPKPKPVAQPPPWLADQPQGFTPQQRKF